MNPDQIAEAIITQAAARGYTPADTVACLATAIQESGLNQTAVSPNGLWVGIYQQDTSYPDRRTAAGNITGFFDRLDTLRAQPGASPDIWLNIFWLQQAPGKHTAQIAYDTGRQAYLSEIKSRAAQAQAIYNRLSGAAMPTNRPDFNEYPVWSSNSQDRDGTPIDLWLIHTEEGGMNADTLAHWLDTADVSYHYTISQASDGGVTVCDVVDTDQAAWSVLASNNRSINLCFAGAFSYWTRDQWMTQAKAIDVAAYLCAQDCAKYDIKPVVIPPPYGALPPGISDHRYCTQYLRDGNDHTDVGSGFPWDIFAAAVLRYTGQAMPVPSFTYPSTDEMVKQIWEQLFGPQAQGWPDLLGRRADGTRGLYLVEAVAELKKGQA